MRTIETETFPEADRVDGCPHPRETYSLLGHEAAEKIFIRAMTGGRSHHAWLVTGVKGVGKATLVYRMARYLLGASQLLGGSLDFSPDDPVVQRIASLGHGNIFILRRPYDIKTKKLKSEIPVAEARKLKDFLTQKPSETGWRIVIIDSMDEMNRNAENSILKSLEEPPEKTMFFLILAFLSLLSTISFNGGLIVIFAQRFQIALSKRLEISKMSYSRKLNMIR